MFDGLGSLSSWTRVRIPVRGIDLQFTLPYTLSFGHIVKANCGNPNVTTSLWSNPSQAQGSVQRRWALRPRAAMAYAPELPLLYPSIAHIHSTFSSRSVQVEREISNSPAVPVSPLTVSITSPISHSRLSFS